MDNLNADKPTIQPGASFGALSIASLICWM
jgi:hypothetical protein